MVRMIRQAAAILKSYASSLIPKPKDHYLSAAERAQQYAGGGSRTSRVCDAGVIYMTVQPEPRPPRRPWVAGAGELLISGDIFEVLVWGSLVT